MNPKSATHNRIRMLILRILSPEHPNPVDAAIVRRCLSDLGYPITEQTLRSYLEYLSERGYVRMDEREQFDILMVSISADGLDLLDGRIKDRGVGI